MRKLVLALGCSAALLSTAVPAFAAPGPSEATYEVTVRGTTYTCTLVYYDVDRSGTPSASDIPLSASCDPPLPRPPFPKNL